MSLFMAMVTKKNMELKIKFTYHLYICAEWSNVLSQFTCSFWISKQSVTAFLLTKKNFHIMVLKVIILNPVLTSKTKTEKNYFCGLNLVWIICFCSNHSNIVTAPLSHTLKRQNRGWRQAWTTDWHHLRQRDRRGTKIHQRLSTAQTGSCGK